MDRDSPILLLDDEDTTIGALALGLVRRGLDVVYANDPDELALIKRERRNSAVLLASPSETLVSFASKIEKTLDTPPERMVVAGPAPSISAQEYLNDIGVRWCLCSCSDEEEIVYVLAAARWDLDPAELRFHARAPTKLEAVVAQGDLRAEAAIGDLSAEGLRLLECPQLDPASPVQVSFYLDGEDVELQANVAWGAEQVGGRRAAVGLCFDMDGKSGSLLPVQRHVEHWLSQHQLGVTCSGTKAEAGATTTDDEQRAHPRTPMAFDALYTTDSRSGAGRLVDLSMSGCLLDEVSLLPEIGTKVQTHVFFQPMAPVALVGTVVRHAHERSFALKFEGTNSNVRFLIEHAATLTGANK